MEQKSGSLTCATGCWLVALLGGVLATALLMVLGGWSFMQGVFVGVVLFVVAGALLSWLICKPLPAPGSVTIEKKTPGEHPSASAPAKPAAPAAAAPAAAAPAVKSTQLPGQEELASRKGVWRYGDAPAGASASSDDGGPEMLSAARDGGADDLKKLKGVGPKLEQTLNELGVFHFDQIAAWAEAEVAWVDERLRFKGRIERDGWIEQAKILAAGGETEFSKRK